MIKCAKCGISKPNDSFHKDSAKANGLSSWCKQCKNTYNSRRTPEYRTRKRELMLAGKLGRYKYLWEYLESHPCVDCGESNILVLEFDHRDGKEKTTSVWSLAGNRVASGLLEAEIEKCDVRCGNCHDKITHKRANTLRYQYFAERILWQDQLQENMAEQSL